MPVDITRVRGQAGEPPVEPLGRIRQLRLGKHHENHLRAIIHVIDRQQQPPVARDRLQLDLAQEPEHIPGHGVLDVAFGQGGVTLAESIKIGERRTRKSRAGGTAIGGRILNALVVPLVTDHRPEERSHRKERFPIVGCDLLRR